MQVRSAGEEAWLGGAAPLDPQLDAQPTPAPLLHQMHDVPAWTSAATGVELALQNPNSGSHAPCVMTWQHVQDDTAVHPISVAFSSYSVAVAKSWTRQQFVCPINMSREHTTTCCTTCCKGTAFSCHMRAVDKTSCLNSKSLTFVGFVGCITV